ncbi:MAG TPA: TlpA disulfide reductase family protein [Steroidobacteraceae bacterium]|nr:TlpA disulfide reductase family protein [Steroidobacteraceae bacterium]
MRSTWSSLLLACMALLTPAAHAGGLAAGAPAPDFVLASRDGSKVRLADLRGDVVMINFWASWCGPCRQEMPLLAQLQAKYEPLGFRLLGINVEPDSREALAWLEGVPVTFPILFDTASEVAGRFGVQGMPSTVFVDRAGNVRYVHQGYKPGDESRYADMIRSLVKE